MDNTTWHWIVEMKQWKQKEAIISPHFCQGFRFKKTFAEWRTLKIVWRDCGWHRGRRGIRCCPSGRLRRGFDCCFDLGWSGKSVRARQFENRSDPRALSPIRNTFIAITDNGLMRAFRQLMCIHFWCIDRLWSLYLYTTIKVLQSIVLNIFVVTLCSSRHLGLHSKWKS